MRTPLAILIVVLAACSDEVAQPLGPPEDLPGPLTIARVSGENQAGTVGEPLGQALVVRVRDAVGRDASGVEVGFAARVGGGSVVPSRITTGADGIAQATFTLGPIAGEQSAVAAITPNDSTFTGPAVTFAATAAPGPPAVAVAAQGNRGWGCAGQELLSAFVVRVEDRFRNPVPGVPLAWTVTDGGGLLSEVEDVTSASGEAAARLALGAEPSVIVVEATVTGLNPVRFTATAADCRAQGSIAFESSRGIELMNADGSERTVLIPGAVSDPDWSPDGARLAYTRRSDGGQTCAIYSARADGSDELLVSSVVVGQCDFDPAWSPDGSMIALARRGATLGYQIAVLNADGSNEKVLDSAAPNSIPRAHAGPTWSPDGTEIAFWLVAHVKFGGGPRIVVINADGTGRTVVKTSAWAPAWSPDGSKVAFGSNLSLMNPDGSQALSLGLPEPPSGPLVRSLGWSPDGAQIVFAGESLLAGDPPFWSPADLYLVHRDGNGLRQLTSTPGQFESDPSWRSEPITTGGLAARP